MENSIIRYVYEENKKNKNKKKDKLAATTTRCAKYNKINIYK